MLFYFDNIREFEIIKAYEGNKNDELNKLLLNFALKHGFSGDIFKKYILYILIYNENNYTLAIELKKSFDIYGLDCDLEYFYELYTSYSYNINIVEGSNDVTKAVDELYNLLEGCSFMSFKNTILSFYTNRGIGDMALYKAFRCRNGALEPILSVANVSFSSIIGYDYQKKLLIENTEAFLNDKGFNNVLLYGDSGTGKSTSIKALLNTYYLKGLRIIEVYKHQMKDIPVILREIKNRPYHFIIYMDDLSFEENEVDYKYLKSIIEGGIEEKPKNVCVYATSNRRHLIKEVAKDNLDDDLHRNETEAEKLSLAYRFGLQIFYSSLTPIEFRNMIKELALRNNIDMPLDEVVSLASRFEIRNGSLSGRCAQQFINSIKNK